MNPTGEHRHLPLREQARITYDRYPILVWAIVATWVVIVCLSFAAAISIGRANSTANRVEGNSHRSELAICAIKDYTDKLVSKSLVSQPSDLEDLSKNLGRLVHCVGPKPTKIQPQTTP